MNLVVCDDEYFLSSALRIAFRGHDVHLCSTGVEAIEWLKTHTPDALLLDIHMPLKSGVDVLKESTYKGRVIILTNFGIEEATKMLNGLTYEVILNKANTTIAEIKKVVLSKQHSDIMPATGESE